MKKMISLSISFSVSIDHLLEIFSTCCFHSKCCGGSNTSTSVHHVVLRKWLTNSTMCTHGSRHLLANILQITGCELLIGANAVTYYQHFLYFSSPHLPDEHLCCHWVAPSTCPFDHRLLRTPPEVSSVGEGNYPSPGDMGFETTHCQFGRARPLWGSGR